MIGRAALFPLAFIFLSHHPASAQTETVEHAGTTPLCGTTFAYPSKDQEIRLFIALQSKVLGIAKEHQHQPFEKGTSNLKEEVQQKIKGLELEKLSSEQLYRLGIACSVASYPHMAGDQNWDLIFDDVCWRSVRLIATRPGSDNAHYLSRMKALFGTDAGPSLWFEELIVEQANQTRLHNPLLAPGPNDPRE